jgi:hypothetical protein
MERAASARPVGEDGFELLDAHVPLRRLGSDLLYILRDAIRLGRPRPFSAVLAGSVHATYAYVTPQQYFP